MRVSPGDIRSGLVNPGYVIPSQRPTIVSTYSVTTKAVRVFHGQGEDAAVDYIEQAFTGQSWRSGGNATKAQIAKRSFNNYRRRADADPRPVALGDSRASIIVAGNEVGAGCDVVTFEPQGGHAGRLCIWSVLSRPFERDELALLACPVVLALGAEFGEDAVQGLEVWMLRDDQVAVVSADDALGQIPTLNTLVRRLTQT